MACAAIVNNAVTSLSRVTLNLPPAPLLERIVTLTLAERAAFDAREKAKRKTHQGNKKGKKSSVHVPPLNPSLKGKNERVKFFNADMQEERIVSYDTYLHCRFMEITNDLLEQGKSFLKYLKTPRRLIMTPTLMLPAMVSKIPL